MIPMRAEDIRPGDECEEGVADIVSEDCEPGWVYIHYMPSLWRRLCLHETVNVLVPTELRS